MKCDLCGGEVKVVGNVTKHYEPVNRKNEWQVKCEQLHTQVEILDKMLLQVGNHLKNNNIVDSTILRGIVYDAEEKLRKNKG